MTSDNEYKGEYVPMISTMCLWELSDITTLALGAPPDVRDPLDELPDPAIKEENSKCYCILYIYNPL